MNKAILYSMVYVTTLMVLVTVYPELSTVIEVDLEILQLKASSEIIALAPVVVIMSIYYIKILNDKINRNNDDEGILD